MRKLIAKPAVCSFDTIRNLRTEEMRKSGYPENIRGWGWFHIGELTCAAQEFLNNYYMRFPGFQFVALPGIDVPSFAIINDTRKGLFSWFIAHGEQGILQVDRPHQACPFGDELLYVPAGWGEKVIECASRGIVAIHSKAPNTERSVIGIKMNPSLPDYPERHILTL